ncbi:hypothetical protein Tco_0369272 [Tanacetum coccineum]
MAFDLRPTEVVLPWPGNANMAFNLRLMEDLLLWPSNAHMEFELWSTEDVLPWPGNANMTFDLRSSEDVLPWPGFAAHDVRHCEANFQMQGTTTLEASKFVDPSFTSGRLEAAMVMRIYGCASIGDFDSCKLVVAKLDQ